MDNRSSKGFGAVGQFSCTANYTIGYIFVFFEKIQLGFMSIFFSVGSGSLTTVLPPSDYYNSSSSYPQYSSNPYGSYNYAAAPGSLLSK